MPIMLRRRITKINAKYSFSDSEFICFKFLYDKEIIGVENVQC